MSLVGGQHHLWPTGEFFWAIFYGKDIRSPETETKTPDDPHGFSTRIAFHGCSTFHAVLPPCFKRFHAAFPVFSARLKPAASHLPATRRWRQRRGANPGGSSSGSPRCTGSKRRPGGVGGVEVEVVCFILFLRFFGRVAFFWGRCHVFFGESTLFLGGSPFLG